MAVAVRDWTGCYVRTDTRLAYCLADDGETLTVEDALCDLDDPTFETVPRDEWRWVRRGAE